MVGGGKFDDPDTSSLRNCFELKKDDAKKVLTSTKLDDLKKPRSGHSVTATSDNKFLIVTGSMVQGAHNQVEQFNISFN